MHDAIGRTQTLTDAMDPARAAALHAVLDREGPPPGAGDPLPAFAHQVYFWAPEPTASLGEDGHTALGGFIPDLGLPDRMWASGALDWPGVVRLGTPATRTSTITGVERKTGKSGPLAFVTLRHEIAQEGRVAVTEDQTLVYRAVPAPGSAQAGPSPAPRDGPPADVVREVQFGPVTLFRYSALTLNGHRIHYDMDYCRQTLGHPGLIVHGPLLAQTLIDLGSAQGPLTRFAFRARAPLFHGQAARACWRADGEMWVQGPEGRLIMTARAG